MLDLTDTITPRSDQLNADDLISGDRTIKITKVSKTSKEQPVAINFEGDNGKPYLPCKSMTRVLVQIWGKDGSKYVGKSMTLFRDAKVTWAGAEVGGIRISHMSDITNKVTLSLTATKQSKKPFVVMPLGTVKPVVAVNIEALKLLADEAVKGGTEALKTWFMSLAADEKKVIQPLMDGYKATAKEND